MKQIRIKKAAALLCLLMAISCAPDTGGYKCINGSCVPITDDAEFLNLEDCQAQCSTLGYDCINGTCVEVGRDTAMFKRLVDCQLSCQ